MIIREFTNNDTKEVIDLWKRCGLVFPQNDPMKDIERKLKVSPDLFLVGEYDNRIIATVMGGYEGHRGWINYLAVSPEYRRKGFARSIVSAVEKLIAAKGCPKINLQVRSTNKEILKFYQSAGYKVDEVISLGKRLIPD